MTKGGLIFLIGLTYMPAAMAVPIGMNGYKSSDLPKPIRTMAEKEDNKPIVVKPKTPSEIYLEKNAQNNQQTNKKATNTTKPKQQQNSDNGGWSGFYQSEPKDDSTANTKTNKGAEPENNIWGY